MTCCFSRLAGSAAATRQARHQTHLRVYAGAAISCWPEEAGRVQAVVDKDLTAAELAITLQADRLLMLTDVPAVIRDYGTPDARPTPAIDTAALSATTFPAGSMGPKVEACIRFARASGQPAAIGALTDAAGILAGRAGTTVSA